MRYAGRMSRSGYEKMVERDVEGKGPVLLLDPAKGTPLSPPGYRWEWKGWRGMSNGTQVTTPLMIRPSPA